MPTKLTSTGVEFPDGTTQDSAATGVPAGIITIWSGSTGSVPSGWALCDGANGTPDLRDRFVVGAGSSYAVDDTGGSDSVTLSESQIPGHTHSVSGDTSNTGDHTHNLSGSTSNTGAHSHSGSTSNTGSHGHTLRRSDSNTAIGNGYLDRSGIKSSSTLEGTSNIAIANAGAHSHNFNTSNTGNHSHNLSGSAASAGAHSHSFSTTSGSTGGGSSHENRPPYYALAYIMKL